MEYSFRISEQEYMEVLKSELRRKRRDPLSLIFVIAGSVVQFACVIFLIAIGYIDSDSSVIMAIMSSLLVAVMAYYQFAIGPQAKTAMSKARDAGYVYQDMDSLIRLKVKDTVLKISGGKNDLSYDCAYFVEYGFIDDYLTLSFSNGKQMHRLIIPASTFGGKEGCIAFASELSRIGFEESRDTADEGVIAEVSYTSTEKEFARGFIRCSRHSYLTSYSITTSFLLKILLAAFFVWYVVCGSDDSSEWDAVAIFAALFLVYRPIAVFSPIMRLSANKYAKTLFKGRETVEFTVTASEHVITVMSGGFCNHFATDGVVCVEETKNFLFVYMRGGVMLFIPITAENSASVSRCYVFLSNCADKNKKNKAGLADLLKSRK